MKGIPREVEAKEKHRVTNSKEMRAQRAAFSLTALQRSVLIGTLLGDGHLYGKGWSRHHRLQLLHGKAQKEYLFWKYEVFRNACFSEPSYQDWNTAWSVKTMSHSAFDEYANIFYRNGKKLVPTNLSDLLNPLALAVWFMDDGARGPRGSGYILNTQSFSRRENEFLRVCLRKRFSLDHTSLHRDRKWWRLYIRKGSQELFYSIIEPFMIPSMHYKFHAFDPVETTRRLPTNVGMKI